MVATCVAAPQKNLAIGNLANHKVLLRTAAILTLAAKYSTDPGKASGSVMIVCAGSSAGSSSFGSGATVATGGDRDRDRLRLPFAIYNYNSNGASKA